MKVLVTGFEPFGGEKVNPALEAVKGLPAEIHGCLLYTSPSPRDVEESRMPSSA